MHVQSFPPVADASATVLVLGSMPGKASLLAGQYYAHPRNLFWPLMGELFGFDAAAPYPTRLAQLLAHQVALWDVLQACFRTSSLDSDILASSVVPNDFAGFLEAHPSIRAICFNGAKAAALFERHVLRTLEPFPELARIRLPSTSPANAGIPRAKKVEAWRALTTWA